MLQSGVGKRRIVQSGLWTHYSALSFRPSVARGALGSAAWLVQEISLLVRMSRGLSFRAQSRNLLRRTFRFYNRHLSTYLAGGCLYIYKQSNLIFFSLFVWMFWDKSLYLTNVEYTLVLVSIWWQAVSRVQKTQIKFGCLLTYSYICQRKMWNRFHKVRIWKMC